MYLYTHPFLKYCSFNVLLTLLPLLFSASHIKISNFQQKMSSRTANSSSRNDESLRTGQHKENPNYWGFANFPNQVFRRAVKNGFDFTLMVVGEAPALQTTKFPPNFSFFFLSGRSGLGKSTFINTLFLAEINNLNEKESAPTHPHPSTVRVEEKLVKLVENSVSLNLTLVDTPGFGDAVNNSKW